MQGAELFPRGLNTPLHKAGHTDIKHTKKSLPRMMIKKAEKSTFFVTISK